MKNYNAIDLMKFILGLMVVAIHTNPFESVSPALNLFFVDTLSRLAVPLFFLSSGFFVANKLNDNKVVLNYVKRTIMLYLVWSIIYLPINVYNILQDKSFISLYIRRFFFEGSYYILWFLPALAFGVILLKFLYNLLNKQLLIPGCVILYILGAMGQSYYSKVNMPPSFEVYYSFFLTTRNGLFFAFPFLCLGVFIRKNPDIVSKKNALIYSIVCFILLSLEVFFARNLDFSKGNGMWIFVLPTAFFVFIYITNIRLKDSPKYLWLRKLSTLLFLSHGIFVIAFAIISPRIGLTNSILQFLFVLIQSLILSQIILKIKKLKFLYE